MKAGWEAATVGAYCRFENGDRGKNYPGRKAFVPAGVPFVNAGHLGEGLIDLSEMNYIPRDHFERLGSGKIQIGDLLFCLRGSLGKYAVVDNIDEGAIASSLVIVRPNEKLAPRYLGYYFGSPLCADEIAKYANGAAQPNLSAKSLAAFEIPLPPLEEQQRIVAVLDEAFEGLARARTHAEANLQNARELFESYLAAAFSGDEAGWEERELNDHVRFIDYRGKTPPKTESGIRLITAKNVKMGYIQREPEEFILENAYEGWMTRGFPKLGDVLFTTEAPLANVAQLDTEETVVIGQRLITMQVDQEVILPEFLKFSLMSPPMQSEIHRRGTGATVVGIKAKLLKTVPLRFPNDLDRQRTIAANCQSVYDDMERLEEAFRGKLQDLNDLRQSLLQKAFAGELT